MTHTDSTFRSQFLHFDSANATYIPDVNNTTTSTTNPYRSQYAMSQTFHRVKRVHLCSLELPVGFTNVRTGSTNTFSFSLNGSFYSVV